MVSSQSVATEQHVRGCHRGRNGSARTMVIGVGETVQKRSHGVAEPPYDCLYMYLSGHILPLRTARAPLRRHLRYCTLTADAHWSGTVDHSRPDCLISGDQQSQDRRTKLSVSGKQLLGYVPEYVDSWLPILLQLSSHRRGSASKRPPRACSTCVPRKANRMWLTSHCMSLVAAADSETTHIAE